MMVKNWSFQTSSNPPPPLADPFTHEEGDCTDQNGAPGQGHQNPPGRFFNHFIVEYGGQYYDPSYGGSVHSSKEDWEDASIDGFQKIFNVLENGQPKRRRLAKQNPSSSRR